VKRIGPQLICTISFCLFADVSISKEFVSVYNDEPKCIRQVGPKGWKGPHGDLECSGEGCCLCANKMIDSGDFEWLTNKVGRK